MERSLFFNLNIDNFQLWFHFKADLQSKRKKIERIGFKTSIVNPACNSCSRGLLETMWRVPRTES